MTHKELEARILKLPGTWLEYPFGEGTAVYKFGQQPDGKIMAIIAEGSNPLRVSLKCDPQLAKLLRDKYESVLPGYHLNKNHWNTILCTGQVPEDELLDLVRHSYELVKAG